MLHPFFKLNSSHGAAKVKNWNTKCLSKKLRQCPIYVSYSIWEITDSTWRILYFYWYRYSYFNKQKRIIYSLCCQFSRLMSFYVNDFSRSFVQYHCRGANNIFRRAQALLASSQPLLCQSFPVPWEGLTQKRLRGG